MYGNESREDAKMHVKPGWHGLIDRAYDKLPEGFHVVRVKEKFGALRIYTDMYSEEYQRFLHKLADQSAQICEYCGKPGSTRSTGYWIKAICDECLKGKE
jgi:hypothetical protein